MIRRLERDFFVKSIDGYVTFNLFSVALAKKLPSSTGRCLLHLGPENSKLSLHDFIPKNEDGALTIII
jgi:hypothetical protein